MSVFRVERSVPLDAVEAWRRMTDWPAHGRRIPLTAVRVRTAGPTGAGTVLVARTALGPLGFDDPMEVVVWRPPAAGGAGHCRLEKRGRVVTGWAEIRVREEAGRTRVVWLEELGVAFLPPVCDLLAARFARPMFGRVVDGLLRG